MNKRKLLTLMGGVTPYYRKVIKLFGSSLVAYWPLWESTGTVANDISGNNLNGAYYNTPTLASAISPNGKPMISVVPIKGMNAYTAGLSTAFPYQEGSTSLLMSVSSAAILAEVGSGRAAVYFYVDSNNYIKIGRSGTTAGVFQVVYRAGGTTGAQNVYLTKDSIMHVVLTWSLSNNRFRFYFNGSLGWGKDNTTAIGEFAGALSSGYARVGYGDNEGLSWSGLLGDVFVVDYEMTATEVKRITPKGFKRFSILGDSVSQDSETNIWSIQVRSGYKTGQNGIISHALGGQGIMPVHVKDMALQVAEAATDDANIIIINLGLNDNNAGDMTALQAEYEAGIIALKASNPNATIYSMNVTKCWTDVGGGTETDKSNIRVAIAAACTAQSITCWDTYTDPWFDAADTSDGVHPTAAGHAKIAAEVLALLP